MFVNNIYKIISLIFGYILGSISISAIIFKLKNINIKEKGSCNLGATNTYRLLGIKYAIFVFLFDFCKEIFAYIIILLLTKNMIVNYSNYLLMLYAGVGIILGHDFSIFNKFKGGKGVSASLGYILVLNPKLVILPVLVFVFVAIISKYISLASISGFLIFLIEIILFYKFENFYNYRLETSIIYISIVILGILTHNKNIKRLLNNTENKFEKL